MLAYEEQSEVTPSKQLWLKGHDTLQDQRGSIESENNEYSHSRCVLVAVICLHGGVSFDLSLILDLVGLVQD